MNFFAKGKKPVYYSGECGPIIFFFIFICISAFVDDDEEKEDEVEEKLLYNAFLP